MILLTIKVHMNQVNCESDWHTRHVTSRDWIHPDIWSGDTVPCQSKRYIWLQLSHFLEKKRCSVIQKTGSYFWSHCFLSSDRKCSWTQNTYCSCHSLVSDFIWSVSDMKHFQLATFKLHASPSIMAWFKSLTLCKPKHHPYFIALPNNHPYFIALSKDHPYFIAWPIGPRIIHILT